MRARDLMRADVLTVHEDDAVEDVLHELVVRRYHGAPVVDRSGRIVGMVSQQDLFFGTMTRNGRDPSPSANHAPPAPGLAVRQIMTSPPVFAREDDDLRAVCRMMAELGIHRLPVVSDGRVVGILSSLDVCAAIGRGESVG